MNQEIHTDPRDNPQQLTEMDRIWHMLAVWFHWRRFILIVTILGAIAAIIIALLLPVSYTSTAAVIIPEQASGGLASVLGGRSVSPLVSGFLQGPSGDYTRYLAILNSREVLENTIGEFDLRRAYKVDTQDPRLARLETLELLQDNVEFEIDAELEFLAIKVSDSDSVRAADIANFLVDELNRVNMRMTSETAGSYRRYVEARYRQSQGRVDSLFQAQQGFQEKYGIIELPTQLESFYGALAEYRMQVAQAEVSAEATRGQYGSDNPATKLADDGVRAARRQYQRFLSGQDELMSVAFNELPQVGREYAELFKEMQLETEILKVLGPLYEQSVLDQEKESLAVQVLDRAIPSVKKSWPPRAIIVIAATLSVFLLCLIFALVSEWWRNKHAYVRQSLAEATRKL